MQEQLKSNIQIDTLIGIALQTGTVFPLRSSGYSFILKNLLKLV
jgi:hypothetical protein